MNTQYKGWRNKETLIINRYISDEFKSRYWLNEYERVRIHQHGGQYFIPNGQLLERITDVLQYDVTENLLRLDVQGQESRILKEDLLRIALRRVDWTRLATRHIIDYIKANETTTNR